MTHYQTDQSSLYTNAYRHWAQNIAELAYPDSLVNPLYNDHRDFHRWLLDQYSVKVRFQDLSHWLEFPNSQIKTFFMLRWS